MYQNVDNYRELVERLINTENELKQAKEELILLKAKRDRKRKPNPDSKFLNVLVRSRARLKHQEGVNAGLIRRVVLKALVKEEYSNMEFFSKYADCMNRLMGYTPFVEDCKKHAPETEPSIIAQHVVLAGEAKINLVMKKGLVESFDKKLLRMTEAIFTEDELRKLQQESLSEETIGQLTED